MPLVFGLLIVTCPVFVCERCAASTVECYIRSVAEFAGHFKKSRDQPGPEQIRSWQLYLLNEKRVKLSTYIQAICGLRFFYRNTLNQKVDIDRIPLPRYEKKLPVILSKEEVRALLEAPKNLGHRAMLLRSTEPASAYRR
jgi:integrase/recombinase XerD